MFDDCLPKFITPKNFTSIQFVLNGTNGPTRGKLFFILFSGGGFIKVATYSESY